MTKTKRKYLAQWVQVIDPGSPHYKKTGVVMDEEYLHNGVICCRIIVGKDTIAVESQHLKILLV